MHLAERDAYWGSDVGQVALKLRARFGCRVAALARLYPFEGKPTFF